MGWFTKPTVQKLKWKQLIDVNQLGEQQEKPVLYFKHSTRCATSMMALKQFENQWAESDDCEIYFLDLLKYRDISNEIEKMSGVRHESPQVVVMKEGKVLYHASHSDINAREIHKILKQAS